MNVNVKKTISVIILIFSLMVNNTSCALEGVVYLPIEDKVMRSYVKGSGDHTIVLLSGWGTENPINDFQPLADKLSGKYKVVILEYFGYYLSTTTDVERSNAAMVKEIREALEKLEIKSPYILMPHSMSGLYSLYYAHHYPDEVEGIIGIDMSLPQKQCERWTRETFPKSKDKNFTYKRQWDEFYENSVELRDKKYPSGLPVRAFLATDQIKSVNDMVAKGEMKTPWKQMNEDMITNHDLQDVMILDGGRYLHHDRLDEIVEFSKDFIDQHISR